VKILAAFLAAAAGVLIADALGALPFSAGHRLIWPEEQQSVNPRKRGPR
jgi:hypothetical protein